MAEQTLRPGDAVVHMDTGTVLVLDERKDTGDGWWVTNTAGRITGGLADRVLADGTWVPVAALLAEVRRLRAAVVLAPVVGVATDGPRPTEGGDAA